MATTACCSTAPGNWWLFARAAGISSTTAGTAPAQSCRHCPPASLPPRARNACAWPSLTGSPSSADSNSRCSSQDDSQDNSQNNSERNYDGNNSGHHYDDDHPAGAGKDQPVLAHPVSYTHL